MIENQNRAIECQNENGVIFQVKRVSSELFNFYVLKRKQRFKDGTNLWHICVEMRHDHDRYMVLDRIRGTQDDAIRRLDELLETGK